MHCWNRIFLLLSLLGAALLAQGEQARADHSPPTDPIIEVAFEQNINAQAPLDLIFVDETGRTVVLGDYFHNRPVILVFAYYECPMLCTLVLNDLTRALRELEFTPGSHFEVLTISIDPGETPDLAAQKKAAYLAEYNRAGAESGWHFLTGTQEAIGRLADVVGFRYYYDEDIDQYAHPAGITVLTPEGRISRYYFGISYSSSDLRLGLVEASQEKIGSVIDQIYLLCYEYNPETGSYGLVIQNVLRLAGLATVAVVGGVVTVWHVRERLSIKRSSKREG